MDIIYRIEFKSLVSLCQGSIHTIINVVQLFFLTIVWETSIQIRLIGVLKRYLVQALTRPLCSSLITTWHQA